MKRVKDFRPSFTINTADAETLVAGNYYPVNSRIQLRGKKSGICASGEACAFTVLNDRSQAGGSLKNGMIDLMVHRRITADDHYGTGKL